MRKITEGEIHSILRKFFIINSFNLLTKSKDGSSLHYQIVITKPPQFKIPDFVATKNNVVIVIEAKLKYSDLFTGNLPDIVKLQYFLENKDAVEEFKKSLYQIVPPNLTIIGACGSLIPVRSKKRIPTWFPSRK